MKNLTLWKSNTGHQDVDSDKTKLSKRFSVSSMSVFQYFIFP